MTLAWGYHQEMGLSGWLSFLVLLSRFSRKGKGSGVEEGRYKVKVNSVV